MEIIAYLENVATENGRTHMDHNHRHYEREGQRQRHPHEMWEENEERRLRPRAAAARDLLDRHDHLKHNGVTRN